MTETRLPIFSPFAALRPSPDHAADVAAPPYDVLSSAEARAMAEGRPWSFLHISKPEIDLPEGTDVHAPEVYAKGGENFTAMVKTGVLVRDLGPRYYVYRLTMGDHVQTGIAGAASVAAYEEGRIKKHEHTQPAKEDDRVRQIEAVNAHTGPVMITYRHSSGIDGIIDHHVTAGPPDVDIEGDAPASGVSVRHTLWVVSDPEAIAAITGAFDILDALYIADGHHRSAAAARVARARASKNPNPTGEESYNTFLAVAFPDTEVQILDYNRVVKDLNGQSKEEFLGAVYEHFDVEAVDGAFKPGCAGEFGMYLDGGWYKLSLITGGPDVSPVDRLDINRLTVRLLAPILGIGDPRLDPRIGFVGGIRGLGELERLVDDGQMAVAFSLFPTALSDLMDVADAGEVMPPKSTWFEPKLADGLLSLALD
ncbi:MAG: DUF1015 family protein [Rhodospirillales bacterium]|nr:DUF1015 family protein [Rhodospirillales bacterium]